MNFKPSQVSAPTPMAADFSQLINTRMAKGQAMQNIIGSVQQSIEKQREKKKKQQQNEAVSKIVEGLMSPEQLKDLRKKGIDISQVSKGLDDPELFLDSFKTVSTIAQEEARRKAQQKRDAMTHAINSGNLAARLQELEFRKLPQPLPPSTAQKKREEYEDLVNNLNVDPKDAMQSVYGIDPEATDDQSDVEKKLEAVDVLTEAGWSRPEAIANIFKAELPGNMGGTQSNLPEDVPVQEELSQGGAGLWDKIAPVSGPIDRLLVTAGGAAGMAIPPLGEAITNIGGVDRFGIEQDFKTVQKKVTRALQENPKFAEGERKAIEESIDIKPSIFNQEAKLKSKFKSIDRELRRYYQRIQETLADPTTSESLRSDLQSKARVILEVLGDLNVPQEITILSIENANQEN